jgi:hypothetical protein
VEEGPIDVGVVFVTHDQATKVPQPSKGPFYFPPVSKAPEFASVLKFVYARAAVRTNQFDASGSQRSTQLVTVITPIGDQALWFVFGPATAAPRHGNGL